MNFNKKQILDYIKALEHLSVFLKELVEKENQLAPEPVSITEKIKETANLRLLCKKGNWPQAIPEELICSDDYESRTFRAYGIIEQYLQVDLKDKKFLDFGCGDGLVAEVALNFGASLSVGYDVKTDDLWHKINKKDNLIITDSFDEIVGYKFDCILINDVIDHCENQNEVFEKATNLLADNGYIFCRCHPWTSRHGTHIYKKLNKAFVHLVFTEEELSKFDIDPIPTIKNLDPVNNYKEILKSTNLEIVTEKIITTPVEMLFSLEPAIVRRIKNLWIEEGNNSYADGINFPRDILEIDFVDFVLKKKIVHDSSFSNSTSQ